MSNWLRAHHRRRHKPLSGPCRIDRRRLYVLPTRAGYAFAALLMVLLGWSINYNVNLGFVLTFVLGGVAVDAMKRVHDQLSGLTVHHPSAESAFAGTQANVSLRIDVPGSRARYGITVDGDGITARLADLPAGSESVDLLVKAPRRGRLRLDTLRLSTVYPLGLFCAWTWLEFPACGVIWPAPLGDRPLPSGGYGLRHELGAELAGDEEFAGLREWRRGDAATHVAWRASARSETLLVKEFVSPAGGEEVLLDWNALAELTDIEARLSQLSAWVLAAEAAGLRYGLRLPGCELAPDHGDMHRRAALEHLALYGEAADVGS